MAKFKFRLLKGSWLAGLVAVCIAQGAYASKTGPVPDLAREQRLAEQIVDGILDGDPVWLEDAVAKRKFLAIYTDAEADPKGTVILMHGRGMHPDWADTVGPLRVSLTEHGWNTLSVQMPVLSKGTKYYDYVPIFPAAFPRIEAAMKFVRGKGAQRIVWFAHSCSVHMSMAFIETHGDSGIDAYIGAGMGATDYQQPMRKLLPLARLRVPILDIYGADEFPAVIKGAPARLTAFAGRHPSSRQTIAPSTDHYFKGADELLGIAVSAWLEQVEWKRGAQ
jgi:hypothetical protein